MTTSINLSSGLNTEVGAGEEKTMEMTKEKNRNPNFSICTRDKQMVVN